MRYVHDEIYKGHNIRFKWNGIGYTALCNTGVISTGMTKKDAFDSAKKKIDSIKLKSDCYSVRLENGSFIKLSELKISVDGKTNRSIERYADGSIILFKDMIPVAVIRSDNFPNKQDYDKLNKYMLNPNEEQFRKELHKWLSRDMIEIMIDEFNRNRI